MRQYKLRVELAAAGLTLCMVLPTFAAAREKLPADAGYQAAGCQVTVYKEKNFAGESWTANSGWADVGDDWAGKVASIKVQQGVWRFFDDANYQGNHEDLAAGEIKDATARKITSVGSFLCIEAP